ncbi:hypothetical protein C8J42_10857 [Sphingomonas sp. PP-CE-1A-559]|nr:hypothetical protein C8J42_10857 [Sphingomonas sp. PP-CE-1A-559]
MLSTHGADIVTLGRGAVANGDWPNQVATCEGWLIDFDGRILSPLADLQSDDRTVARLKALRNLRDDLDLEIEAGEPIDA